MLGAKKTRKFKATSVGNVRNRTMVLGLQGFGPPKNMSSISLCSDDLLSNTFVSPERQFGSVLSCFCFSWSLVAAAASFIRQTSEK